MFRLKTILGGLSDSTSTQRKALAALAMAAVYILVTEILAPSGALWRLVFMGLTVAAAVWVVANTLGGVNVNTLASWIFDIGDDDGDEPDELLPPVEGDLADTTRDEGDSSVTALFPEDPSKPSNG